MVGPYIVNAFSKLIPIKIIMDELRAYRSTSGSLFEVVKPGLAKGCYIPQPESLKTTCQRLYPKPFVRGISNKWFLAEIYAAIWDNKSMSVPLAQIGSEILKLLRLLVKEDIKDQERDLIKLVELLGTRVEYCGIPAAVQGLVRKRNSHAWVLSLWVPRWGRNINTVGSFSELLCRVKSPEGFY